MTIDNDSLDRSDSTLIRHYRPYGYQNLYWIEIRFAIIR